MNAGTLQLAMASSLVIRRHLTDITQCPICLDVFDTPTSLPCLHTFCLRCLQRTYAADCPGDVTVCPVCRQDFSLPAGGLSTLPRNFTLDGLVELQRAVSATSSAVESRDVDVRAVSEATSCVQSAVDVDDGLPAAEAVTGGNSADSGDEDDCSRCSSLTLVRQHDQEHHAADDESIEDATSSGTTKSDIMQDDDTVQACDDETEFCFDCRVDVRSGSGDGDDAHRRHRRRRVGEVRAECRRRAAGQLARVTDALNSTHVALEHVDQRRVDVLEQLRHDEAAIREECDDDDDDELERRLSALSTDKDDALRQLVARKEHLDMDQTSLETFLRDSSRRLTTATTTAGLLRVVRQVKTEAKSLLRVHQARLDQSDVHDEQQAAGIADLFSVSV